MWGPGSDVMARTFNTSRVLHNRHPVSPGIGNIMQESLHILANECDLEITGNLVMCTEEMRQEDIAASAPQADSSPPVLSEESVAAA